MDINFNYKFNPGALRTPITIQRVSIEKDVDKRPIKVLKDVIKCKAKVTNFQNYRNSAGNESEGNIFIDEKKVVMRVPKIEVLDTDVIILKGIQYNITSINDVEERGRYYEIRIKRAK